MSLIEDIKAYTPYDEEEEKDKSFLLSFLANNQDAFYRSNRVAHMSASAWITNSSMDKVLLAYHNIYQSYTWLGGHADGEEDLLKVAEKEVREESSLTSAKPYDGKIYSLEVLTVNGHIKHGEYVSSHLHLNVTYLFIADEKEATKVKPDENAALAWFDLDEVSKVSKEPWFNEWIYPKLNQKLITLRESLRKGE